MRTAWAVAVAALFVLATDAYADTVYLKDGQTVWGREVTEQGDTVIVVRPGETLRFPKRDVDRIDRWRLSVPKYYDPPTGEGSGSVKADAPVPAPSAPAAEPRASTSTPAAVPAGPPLSTPAPAERAPTLLPPPPPPSPDKPR